MREPRLGPKKESETDRKQRALTATYRKSVVLFTRTGNRQTWAETHIRL